MMSRTDHRSNFELSVIIPSYNRHESLSELMDALARQSVAADRFEVVVVLDGSTDSSAEMLAVWSREHPGYSLRVIEQPNQGQSTARSRGAAEAGAPLLLFLDDDVVPEPQCLAAHLQRHQQSLSPVAVLGDAWMVLNDHESYYDLLTRMWWEDALTRRARRHPHNSYRDFYANRVSLSREVFRTIGGFDPAFQGYGGEDYDLGYRLLQAGVRFELAPEAKARHEHRGSSRQVLRNLVQEGRNDVRLGSKHPALRRGLRYAPPTAAARAAFIAPRLFFKSLAILTLALHGCERLGFWRAWRWLLGKGRFVAYWIGVAQAFPNWRALLEHINTAPPPPETGLDITDGLPPDLSDVWPHGPSIIRLRANGQEIDQIHLEAAPQEPLAEHLADVLSDRTWRLPTGQDSPRPVLPTKVGGPPD